jgi:hypothetical protein
VSVRSLAGALTALLLIGSPPGAQAAPSYRAHGVKWPGGIVPYFNAAPDQAWALWQAVSAWSRSGADVRFVATSRANAWLIIRHDPAVSSCERAQATIGFVPGATVKIYPRGDASRTCNRYDAARSLTHELGHVLGLLHEDRACTVMNSSGSYRGGAECDPVEPWEWRCRLLEPDDVSGAIAFYGGSPRPQRASPACALYDPIHPPGSAAATYDSETGGIALSFRRAPDPVLPAFLARAARDAQAGYGYAVRRDRR